MHAKVLGHPFIESVNKLDVSAKKNRLDVHMCNTIGKNSSPTLARDKTKVEYISEGKPSPYELTFEVELGPNPHSKMVSKHFLDPFK